MDNRSLAFRIKAVNNQIRRMLEKNAFSENDADLTGMQYAVLGFLGERSRHCDVYQRNIEAEFNIRRSTASGILKLMEKNGYIQRSYDTVDTRLKKIVMTEKARELDKIAKANIEKVDAQLTKGIPPEEMAQFYRTLDRISENIEAQ